MRTDLLATYVMGPVLALLPKRWRQRLPMIGNVRWERAGTLSGMLEMLASIVGLGYWYLSAMPEMFRIAFNAATTGNGGDSVTEFHIRGAAWILFTLQPLTWLLLYFFVEGAVRLCGAAFAENVVGTLPLAMVDYVLVRRVRKGEARPVENMAGGGETFVGSVREWMMVSRLPEMPDELRRTNEGAEELLEIWASRRKEEWVAPRVVRVDEVYYRLEESWVTSGERPFRYRLRRLAAGVPGRSVILYKSGSAGARGRTENG
jgi:hypothetical protein